MPAASQTTRIGYVNKVSFAGVFEQAILSDAGDQNVREAVVVEVPYRHSHAIHFDIEPGGTGNVGESAVAVIAIKLERGTLARVTGPVHAVDEKDVLPAVGVVIEEGATAAAGFQQQLPP